MIQEDFAIVWYQNHEERIILEEDLKINTVLKTVGGTDFKEKDRFCTKYRNGLEKTTWS